MPDEENQQDPEEDEAAKLLKRFPQVPEHSDAPHPPMISVELPPHPQLKKDSSDGMQTNKMAIASTAASSFVTPIIILSVAGWWLDQKFKTNWIAFVGVVLGFIVGVMQLIRITSKLND